LFARYYQKLCSFAYTYLRQKEEVEEVVSDVFFNLWSKRHQLKIEKNLKAYLYISVKHAAFAVIKRRHPQLVNIDEILLEEQLTEYNTPECSLAFKELESHFQQAIDTLPPRCKQIFLLKWKDDLSYRDIGDILGITEKTVENQLVKAMQVIKEHILFYQSSSRHAFSA
jgi:RNA polymerase sigma-70 factor, ECF subfamily